MSRLDELIRGERVVFDIERSVPVVKTPRMLMMAGLFDLPPEKRSAQHWHVEMDLDADWSIGAIVGPSGSGKSTIARELFGDVMAGDWDWDAEKSILDSFPASMHINDIVGL